MNDARRRILLFATLAMALLWSGWLALNDSAEDVAEPVEAVERRARPAAKLAAPVMPALTTPAAREIPEVASRMGVARADLFPKQTWYIPPPPPPPPPYVPPPPPQAPPLPFTYMGSWQEDANTTYYLSRGNLPVSVRAGQVLDGAWQLEPVTGKTLNFTYLPLKQVRSLRMGD
ncbi:MAG TPA: hypothetical protein PLE48_16350 [Thiobacillus sp.]|nr:MAG: hypothetical protein B7Y50_11290 [Hydrogenophilales bacterium 28-61-11]OZA45738.1 MAG: hypothetical protein B7X81_07840 [Hydrogenophilales bacterium 17-61-76]HQT31215.1 hypothetical protein [Thiobacillus sp.]HQT71974.1 hypothetical protein [Thiobacillus sp.]